MAISMDLTAAIPLSSTTDTRIIYTTAIYTSSTAITSTIIPSK